MIEGRIRGIDQFEAVMSDFYDSLVLLLLVVEGLPM